MSSETTSQVLKTDPQLVKRFHVWLNHVYLVMPQSFKANIKRGDFYSYVRDNYNKDASVRKMNRTEFIIFAHGFVNFTYANILGFYYDIELLIKLVDELTSEFKPFINLLNYGIKDRQSQ